MPSTIPGIDTVITRDQWERPGEEINPANGYTPPQQNWSLIKFGMAHFTAAGNLPDGDPGETLADVLKLIADTQHWYLKIRYFFSLGYLHAVDWTGRAIELRGFEYRAAANNGDIGQWADINLNAITAPVLYLVDGQDRLTPAMAQTGRNLYREYERRTVAAGGSWTQTSPKPHNETDWTGCPGAGIVADIAAGLLDIRYAEPLPPPPLPPTLREQPRMFFARHTDAKVGDKDELFAVTSASHVTGAERDALIALGVTERVNVDEATYQALKRTAG